MPVRFTIAAVIALYLWFDEARATGRWQRPVAIVTGVTDEFQRYFDRVFTSRKPFRDRVTDHLPQQLFIHTSSR